MTQNVQQGPPPLKKTLFMALIGAFMLSAALNAARMPSLGKYVPDYGMFVFWGKDVPLDFRNQYVFAREREWGKALYERPHREDPLKRYYVYPPLLAFVFSWTAFLSWPAASALWSWTLYFGLLAASFGWVRAGVRLAGPYSISPGESAVLAGCLFLSYPAQYAIERGQSDILVLAVLSAAFFAVAKRRWFAAGAAVSAAVMLKVYPVFVAVPFAAFGAAALAAGIARRERRLGMAGARVLCGMAVAALLIAAAFAEGYSAYHGMLRRIAEKPIEPFKFDCHSLTRFDLTGGLWIVGAMCAAAAAAWIPAMLRWARAEDTDGPEAGQKLSAALVPLALGVIATLYASRWSYDYNLILAIPLAALAGTGAYRCADAAGFSMGLFLFFLGCWLPRWVNHFIFPDSYVSVFILLEVTGIFLMSFAAARRGPAPGRSGKTGL